MALQDYYNTGDTSQNAFNATTWDAQTFTTNSAYTIGSVKLLLYRIGTPGTITVSIRATSGGQPTGGDLTSGTTDGDTLPTGSPYEWRQINLTPYALSNATQYAIVVRAAGNLATWRADVTAASYSGGTFLISSNAGSTWTSYVTWDFMFETYDYSPSYVDVSGTISGIGSLSGNATLKIPVDVSGTISGVGSLSGSASKVSYVSVSGTIAGVGSLSGRLSPSVGAPLLTRRLVVVGGDTIFYES